MTVEATKSKAPHIHPTLTEEWDVGQVQSARGENFYQEQTVSLRTNRQTQTLNSLLFISWHTGEGFSLAQRVYDEGGATLSPERHSGGLIGRYRGRWVELRVCVWSSVILSDQ